MFKKSKKKKQLRKERTKLLDTIDAYKIEHTKAIKRYFSEKNPVKAHKLLTEVYHYGYTVARLQTEVSYLQYQIKSL